MFLGLCAASEWRGSGRSAGVLLSVVHFLSELLGLLFVDEAKGRKALFELECMEKSSVLVVVPCVKDFLVPDDASVGRLIVTLANQRAKVIYRRPEGSTHRNVHHFQPVRVANQVIS